MFEGGKRTSGSRFTENKMVVSRFIQFTNFHGYKKHNSRRDKPRLFSRSHFTRKITVISRFTRSKFTFHEESNSHFTFHEESNSHFTFLACHGFRFAPSSDWFIAIFVTLALLPFLVSFPVSVNTKNAREQSSTPRVP